MESLSDGWIKLSDDRPKPGQRIWVAHLPTGRLAVQVELARFGYFGEVFIWSFDSGLCPYYEIIGWMPIEKPEPPPIPEEMREYNG